MRQEQTIQSYATAMPKGGRLGKPQDSLKSAEVVVIGDGGGKGDGGKKAAFKKQKNLVQSQLLTTNSGTEGVALMDVRIADFLLSNGLAPSLSECPKLKLMLEQAKHVPNTYKPPTRQTVAGPLLDATYSTVNQETEAKILKESRVMGITIFGDGATYLRIPFINILAAGVHNDAGLLDIVDCSGHVAKGYKKDAEYIAKIFLPHMERLDPDKTRYVPNSPISRTSLLTTYIAAVLVVLYHIIGLTCVRLMEHQMSRRRGPSYPSISPE